MLEEQSAHGLVDNGPMTLYQMLVAMEKQGHMDLVLTGHSVQRPAAVARGEESDHFIISHSAHSVFKPNQVAANKLKGTNLAGYIGYTCLANSNFLGLVWRILVLKFLMFFSFGGLS